MSNTCPLFELPSCFTAFRADDVLLISKFGETGIEVQMRGIQESFELEAATEEERDRDYELLMDAWFQALGCYRPGDKRLRPDSCPAEPPSS